MCFLREVVHHAKYVGSQWRHCGEASEMQLVRRLPNSNRSLGVARGGSTWAEKGLAGEETSLGRPGSCGRGAEIKAKLEAVKCEDQSSLWRWRWPALSFCQG